MIRSLEESVLFREQGQIASMASNESREVEDGHRERISWVVASSVVHNEMEEMEEDMNGTNEVQQNSIVIEVVHTNSTREGVNVATGARNASAPTFASNKPKSADEDCLTMTEVTDLSTIDEITVEEDEEEEDENSCRTTATMVSSNAGTPPSILSDDHYTTTAAATRTTKSNSGAVAASSRQSLLRSVSQHCQVKNTTKLCCYFIIDSTVLSDPSCYCVVN